MGGKTIGPAVNTRGQRAKTPTIEKNWGGEPSLHVNGLFKPDKWKQEGGFCLSGGHAREPL